jgi:hypothetical protein
MDCSAFTPSNADKRFASFCFTVVFAALVRRSLYQQNTIAFQPQAKAAGRRICKGGAIVGAGYANGWLGWGVRLEGDFA